MPRIHTAYFTPALLICLATVGPVHAQTSQDTVRWDDRAGQWVYTLFNPANLSRYKEVRYTPRTLIEPSVKSKVQWDKDVYEYRYRIKNAAGARQPIGEVSIHAPKWDASAPQRPEPVAGESHAQALDRVRSGSLAVEAFVAKTVYAPNRWKPFLNLNNPTQVVFGWLTDYQKSYYGIAPRTAQDGFSVLRAELPGAGWMELQGYTPDMYNAATLPRVGAVAEQVEQVHRNDSVDVTVLVPAIIVPKPYNGAELARRLKAHAATWPDAGLINADTLLVVNAKLDALVNALQANDKKAAKAAAQSLLAEVRKHHAGMVDANTDDDEDAHDSKADKRTFISARGTLEEATEPVAPIHRVAVRALAFNLKYLMDRMESAR